MPMFKELPPPLLRQIVLRFGGAILSLFICVCVFFLYEGLQLGISMLVISLVAGASGARIYYTASTGKYIIVEGICQKVEQTLVFRRNKAVYLFAEPHTIKVFPHRRNADVQVGDVLRIYIATRTPVYHVANCELLSDYLAMEIVKGAG